MDDLAGVVADAAAHQMSARCGTMRRSRLCRRARLLGIACVLTPTLGDAQNGSGRAGTVSAFVDSIVRREALQHGVPALAVSVYRCAQPLMVRAWGVANLDPPRAASAATTFNIASLTKPFTAAVVLHLVRTGVLRLDAPARQYVHWLPDHYATITIRQLLGHTSGIVRDVRRDNNDDPDEDEYRTRVRASERSSVAGTRFEYSNTGYAVLGWAAEAASGRSLSELYQAEVWQPAQLSQASYRVPMARDAGRARPHEVVARAPVAAPVISGGFASGGMALRDDGLAPVDVVARSVADHLLALGPRACARG